MSFRKVSIVIRFAIIQLICISLLSCGHYQRDYLSNNGSRTILSNSGISVRVFDESGNVINNPSEKYRLDITQEGNSRQVEISLKKPITVHSNFLEVRFDGEKEHPSDIQTSTTLFTYKPLEFIGSPATGLVICAQVLPGSKHIVVSGELLRLTLDSGPQQVRMLSDFKQDPATDPIIADPQCDPIEKNKIYWSFKLRGEANSNQLYDFADFGEIGKYYNKETKNLPISEPCDGFINGKIDFADFGVVGANYSRGIGGLKIYRDDNPQPTTLLGVLDTSGKIKGDFTLDKSANKSLPNGFKQYWYSCEGTGRYIKIQLLDKNGGEKTGHLQIIDTLANTVNPPNNIQASDGIYKDKVVVTWSAPTEGVVPDGYIVYRSATETGEYTNIGTVGAVTTFEDVKVPNSNVYYYKVSSILSTLESSQSTADAGSLKKIPPSVDPPSSVVASDSEYVDKILVTWKQPITGDTPDGYKIYRSNTENGTYAFIASIGTVTNFEDYKIFDSNVYYYKVSSTLGTLESTLSTSDSGSRKFIVGDWQMYGREPTHNKRSPFIGPNTGTLKWSNNTGFNRYSSAIFGADGSVFVGGKKNLVIGLNHDNSLRWTCSAVGTNSYSTPAFGPDGTMYDLNEVNYLHAINPDGSIKWKYGTISMMSHNSPTVGPDGTIYFNEIDGDFYAINPDGTFKWSQYLAMTAVATPAIGSDGTIYTGCYINMYAFNPDGTGKWTFPTDDEINSSPSIGPDGSIYFGCKDGKLYSIKPNKSLNWTYQTDSTISFSSPAIAADGTIYIGCKNGKFYAINPNGKIKWSYPTGGEIRHSPAISADGTIYIGSYDKNLYALNPDGSVKWTFAADNSISTSSPSISEDGSVFFVDDDNKLYSIGPGAGKYGLQPPTKVAASDGTDASKIVVSWSAPASGPVPDGYYILSSLSNKGVWQYIGMTTSKSFDDTYAESGKTYYYKVQSYKYASGYNDSSDSAIDSGSRK